MGWDRIRSAPNGQLQSPHRRPDHLCPGWACVLLTPRSALPPPLTHVTEALPVRPPRRREERIMAQAQGLGKRYIKAFFKGFFVAVPITVTFLDRVACVARVEGASMQPSLNPGGRQASDVVLLNHWSIRNYDVQRGDIVSLVLFLYVVLFIRKRNLTYSVLYTVFSSIFLSLRHLQGTQFLSYYPLSFFHSTARKSSVCDTCTCKNYWWCHNNLMKCCKIVNAFPVSNGAHATNSRMDLLLQGNCSLWEGLMLEKFVEDYLPHWDPTLEHGKSVRSPPLKRKGWQKCVMD
uniref:Uncharacterized protein n=5 Tax=Neoaves TaxID=3078114 RepID=A0A8V5GW37_MELUD